MLKPLEVVWGSWVFGFRSQRLSFEILESKIQFNDQKAPVPNSCSLELLEVLHLLAANDVSVDFLQH